VPDTITNDQVVAWVRAFAAQVAEQKSALTKLDAAIGDGDHGTNMDRGMRKVLEKLDGAEGDDIGATLKAVGMALVSSVGGASGPLYGTLFMQMGAGAAGATELDLSGWTEALAKGAAGVQARGKAELQDKTMIDALIPAVEALKEHAGDSLADALTASADAAQIFFQRRRRSARDVGGVAERCARADERTKREPKVPAMMPCPASLIRSELPSRNAFTNGPVSPLARPGLLVTELATRGSTLPTPAERKE